MKRIHSVILCILLFVSMTISVYAVSSVPESVLKATESVVRVLAEYADGYATGSGFVIKSDKEETLIATNYHVVEGEPYSISVWLSEEETVSATILAYTNQKDMCILKLAYPVSLKPLTFSDSGAKQGEAVYAVGFPGAADYLSDKEAHTSADATITDGIVSAVREVTVSSYGTPTKILQINAAINSGNSGGPLFNINGEVVGINTYGINDSQGIFGAIDVSELKSFMADNAIAVPKATNEFPWAIVVIFAAVLMGIAAISVVIVRKKKMKAPTKTEVKNISLREYMVAYPNGIGIHDAVAMLLPVALCLRDLHNNGAAHLQVSPNSISVGANGAVLADATTAESDRYSSGYAAPEIYRGSSAGDLSDVYSFCAVLYYVASGKQPMNSLSRIDADKVIHDDTAFAEIIQSGMALDSANRIASMQDVIIKLSPYYVRPFENTTVVEQNQSPKPITQKAKPAQKRIVLVVTVLVVVALLGSYVGCYFAARINAQNGEFATADSLLFAVPITKIHDAKLVAYIEAGQLMVARNYDGAKVGFESVSGYMNADELVKEADYRYAAQYADANNFEDAEAIYLGLGDYKDSAVMALEVKYREGTYVLLEKKDYLKAFTIFYQLSQKKYEKADEMMDETQYLWALAMIEDEEYVDAFKKLTSIKNYSDVKEVLKALEKVIYAEGQNLYYSEKFSEAKKRFDCISSYSDSKKYLTLIEAHSASLWSVSDSMLNSLINIFYFEDASELLLSTQAMGKKFLLGTWRGDGYYFTMEEDGHINYNLPWFNYGDYYRIKDGIMLLYPENNYNSTKALFAFEAVTPDCIEVFCYQNNRTYTLYRQ